MPAARLPCGGGVASPSLNKYYATHMNPGSEATHIFLPFSGSNSSPLFTGDTEPRHSLVKHRGYQSKTLVLHLFPERAESRHQSRCLAGCSYGRFFYVFSYFFSYDVEERWVGGQEVAC